MTLSKPDIMRELRRKFAPVWRRYSKETIIPLEVYQILDEAVNAAYEAGRDNPRAWPDEEITGEYPTLPKEVG